MFNVYTYVCVYIYIYTYIRIYRLADGSEGAESENGFAMCLLLEIPLRDFLFKEIYMKITNLQSTKKQRKPYVTKGNTSQTSCLAAALCDCCLLRVASAKPQTRTTRRLPVTGGLHTKMHCNLLLCGTYITNNESINLRVVQGFCA